MSSRRIGRYQVLGQLATGGMAEVLLCALRGPSRFERLVVVKRILPHLAKLPHITQMFVDEARNLGRVIHPNVVQVHEFGNHENELFMAMEYIAGEDLATLYRRLGKEGEQIDPAVAAYIGAEACAGLHAAHELVGEDGAPLGIVHRDISPQNVIVTYDGHVKVLDFGIALAADRGARSDAGSLKGKLEYMSPEQIRGLPLDRRSDLFALGVVLHELVTGRRLYDRGGAASVVEAICHEPTVWPSRLVDHCPPALDEAIFRSLEKNRDARYASAAEMRRDLLAVARDVVDPSESLGATMKRLFTDRIAKKASLLATLRERPADHEGHERDVEALSVTIVSSGEDNEPTPGLPARVKTAPIEDTPVESDNLATNRQPGQILPTLLSSGEAPVSLPPVVRTRRTGRTIAVGAAIAFVLLVGSLTIWLRARAKAWEARTVAPVATAIEPASTAVDASVLATVVVSITTTPVGAHVLVGGEAKGDSPVEVTLPRASVPVSVQIDRPGSEPVSQVIVPDRDQSLMLSLVASPPRVRAVGRAPAGRPSAAPRPSSSGFFRFE